MFVLLDWTCGRHTFTSSSMNNSSVCGSAFIRFWSDEFQAFYFKAALSLDDAFFCLCVFWTPTHTPRRAMTCLFSVCLEICVISILPPLNVSSSLSNSLSKKKYWGVWTACSTLKKKSFLPFCTSLSKETLPSSLRFLHNVLHNSIVLGKSCCVNVTNPIRGEAKVGEKKYLVIWGLIEEQIHFCIKSISLDLNGIELLFRLIWREHICCFVLFGSFKKQTTGLQRALSTKHRTKWET